jgi:hypothetical protein
MFPIAYFAHWVERSILGFVAYFFVFVGVFVFVWLVQYAIFRDKINRINKKVKEKTRKE